MKYLCSLEFSESGRICWVKLAPKTKLGVNLLPITVAELLLHGPLEKVISAAARMDGQTEETNGVPIPKVFRGELFQLAGYEYLNKSEEKIEER